MQWTLTCHLQYTSLLLAYDTAPMQQPQGSRIVLGTLSFCRYIWRFYFSRNNHRLPASPLVSVRISDRHGINLLFSFLTPNSNWESIFLQKKKIKKHKKEVFPHGACILFSEHQLRHMRCLSQFQWLNATEISEFPSKINVLKWNRPLKLPPEALRSPKWERKHFRHAY